MKQNVNSIRVGNVINHKSRMWRVVKTLHVKPGKGGAFIQMELKEVKNGSKLNERFRSEDSVDRAHVEERNFQFLYQSDNILHLMDVNNYDQKALELDLIDSKARPFLAENMKVQVSFIEEEAVNIILPSTVIAEIETADAVVKGQTATSSFKPAVLKNGVKVMVPQYISTGEKVVIDTYLSQFVERHKG